MTEGLFRRFVERRRGRVGYGLCVLALPRLHWVVHLPIVVGVEELFKPLDELKVVLELPFHQFVDWDDLETQKRKRIRTRMLVVEITVCVGVCIYRQVRLL